MLPGRNLDPVYYTENLELVERGLCNLKRHIKNSAKFGVPVVVAINRFDSDSDDEIALIREGAKKAGTCTRDA